MEGFLEKITIRHVINFCVIILLGVVLYNSIYKVPSGYAALRYDLDGGISDETYGQGWHIIRPTSRMIIYPVSTEVVNMAKSHDEDDVDNSVLLSTSDGKSCTVSVMYTFHIVQDKLPDVFTKFRGQSITDIENGYLKSELLRCINEVTSQYNLMQVVGDKRQEINEAVFARFRANLEPHGIIIETVSISEAQPDDATAEAIQNVINSQNMLEKARIDKQTAEVEAQKLIIAAEGRAQAQLIEAQAQAEANAKLQESLNELIIQRMWIQKWEGKLPNVMTGNSNGMIFNIPTP